MNQGLLISYRYDALDRLIGVEPVGAAATTRVYHDGRLATQFEGDQQHSLIEAGGHVLAQSSRTGNRVENSLLACDQQRSVLQSVTGSQIQRSAYTPYGGQAAEGGLQSLLGFNGEQPDPVTGCYLLGNGYRAYNPELLRFHSPDSMSPFGAGGVNPYAYCVGDPVNLSDPTGHFSWRSFLSIAISAAAIAFAIVTLGSGVPLTGPLIAAAALNLAADAISIAGQVTSLLAPESKAGTILGGISFGLAVVSFSAPYAVKAGAKLAASKAGKAAGRAFSKAVPNSVAGAALRQSSSAYAKSAQRTAAALDFLSSELPRRFVQVKWAGYGVKGQQFVDDYVIPYFSPPSTGQSEQAPSTLDAFVRGEEEQIVSGPLQANIKLGNFLTADQNRMQDIREF